VPCTFDGWVPVLDFYIKGFSSSCLLAAQLGRLTSFPSDPAVREKSKNYFSSQKDRQMCRVRLFSHQSKNYYFSCPKDPQMGQSELTATNAPVGRSVHWMGCVFSFGAGWG